MSIEIKGRKKLQAKMDKAARASDPSVMASRLRATRCPTHGQAPQAICVVGSEVTAEFCCERARDVAAKATTDAITAAFR